MFNFQLLMISALTPVAVLIWYLYRKDKANPEPPLNLVLAFVAGILSVFLSLAKTIPMSALGFDFSESESMIGQAFEALFMAALPEEMAKLLMFLIVIHFMKNFDEYIDGAVYCGIVGLGFAGFENIMYIAGAEDMISTSIGRALMSIPGHFSFGIAMGYYFSRSWFDRKKNWLFYPLIIVVPVFAHWVYDALLMCASVAPEGVDLFLMLVFFAFFAVMMVITFLSIRHLQKLDKTRELESNMV
ncbi:MAG: PrsW family intramembrane metalloprotease [Prevotella sp.]|nr:PrsW family intramembrane metalloprotease [Prevotella sp.]